MNKIVYITILFLFTYSLYSQRETDNWYFGDKAGLNFLNPNPEILNDGQMIAPAGCASISDNQGNLLFYTNGKTVWNRNHQTMENGEDLAGDIEHSQSSIIIPKPNDNNTFFLFTTRKTSSNRFLDGLYVSEIRLTNDFPNGKVFEKNIRLNAFSSEKITAVHSNDSKSIWVITLSNLTPTNKDVINSFYVYNVSENGLNYFTPQITSFFDVNPSIGTMKISPNGKIIAMIIDGFLNFFEFNNTTGEIIPGRRVNTATSFTKGFFAYGLEFSNDSNIMYWTSSEYGNGPLKFTLKQFDLNSNNVLQIGETIFSIPDIEPGSIQLGSDCKIYVTYNDENNSIKTIGVINKPNKLGIESDYNHTEINLAPNTPLKGLPNFIQSYFRNRIITDDNCVSDTFNFSVDTFTPITSILWDFGDGNISTDLNPTHLYSNSGNYIVTAFVEYNNITVPFYKEVEAFSLPQLLPNQNLVQCDINNDGIDFFDLFDIREKITNSNLDEELIFYRNRIDAENNENSINNPEQFQNESNPQEIYVRVISDKGCFNLTSFEIKSRFVQLDSIDNIFECDNSDDTNGDNNALFDLRIKRGDIINQFNLTANSQVRFYANLTDAQITNNELDLAFISPSTTIYTRIDTNLDCGGIAPFNLIVNQTPIINLNDNYILCIDSVTNPPLILDGNNSNDRFEWRNSLGNIVSIGREFTIIETGDYSLTVYKRDNGIECSNYKEFTVSNPDSPIFQNISVNTESDINSVNVSISGNSNYQFSLDNLNFFGFGLNHTFTNVEPGVKTVYVKDVNNCEAEIQTNISVINFPSFFTPNFDRRNDQWIVKGLSGDFFSAIRIEIFDRHGKSLYLIDSRNFEEGWNGSFKQNRMPPTNYWYKAVLIDNNGKEIKKTGSIALIR